MAASGTGQARDERWPAGGLGVADDTADGEQHGVNDECNLSCDRA